MPKLGQHFLASDEIADRIVSSADIRPGESVVEIGPGEGMLTRRLLARSKRVAAVELDARLVERLRTRFGQEPGLQLFHGDFLRIALAELPSPAVVVANLPYAVAAPILQRVLAWPGWSRAVLMFQKEVAERIVAAPGTRKYGLLTVSVAMRARVEWVCDAPKRFFSPPPKVDSAVVRLDPRGEPLLPPELAERSFLDLVRAAFAHRRKTVLNSLAHALRLDKEEVARRLAAAGLDPRSRAEDISPEEFVVLCQKSSF